MSSKYGYPSLDSGTNTVEALRSYLRILSDKLAFQFDDIEESMERLRNTEAQDERNKSIDEQLGTIRKKIKEFEESINDFSTRIDAAELSIQSLDARVTALEEGGEENGDSGSE